MATSNLKIKPEHFEVLKTACEATLAAHPGIQEKYRDAGHSSMRFNWDILNASKINGDQSCKYLSDVLYKYLHDTHINSALAKIFGNDGLSAKQVAKKTGSPE